MPYVNMCSDEYRKNIFNGFAYLQQEQEFVDLTLAMDGHLVKVHKNIMALASPYIRDILKKSPSDNLVIYLNNVNHEDLNSLLEFIYQGEVNIPEDRLESFLQLAQSLHVTGIDKVDTQKNNLLNTHSGYNNNQKNPFMRTLQENESQNKSSAPCAASIIVNADHNYPVQLFPDDRKNHGIPLIIESPYTVEGSSDKCSKDYHRNEEENIEIIENDIMQSNSIVDLNEIPKHINDIPANDKVVTDYTKKNSLELSEYIIQNNNEEAMDIPYNNIKVPYHVLDVANENNIPLNTIGSMRDDEIPTDIHIIIPKPISNEDQESQQPYSVTVKPLSSLQDSSEEVLPALGTNLKLDKEYIDALKIISQYSMTERGCIQIIVSRYIYNSHHEARGGRKHRWRCSDYRKKKCPAYIDSMDNHIILRKGLHNHGYHDDKIYKKHEKGQIYHSLKQAENVRRKPTMQTVNPDSEDVAQVISMKY